MITNSPKRAGKLGQALTDALTDALPIIARTLALGLILALPAAPAWAQSEIIVGLESQDGLTVTVYNQDLAMISERRRAALTGGENRLALTGVSRQIRPESLILEGAGLTLLEQAFEADVLSQRHLLERALGGPLWVRRSNPRDGSDRYLEAILVSLTDPALVRIGDRLETVARDRLAYPVGLGNAPGLRDRPTLTALLDSDTAGDKNLSISYLTRGLSWQADYVGLLDAGETQLALTALVTLTNNSGTAFTDAALRLVAGDVNQVQGAPQPRAKGLAMMAEADSAAGMTQAAAGDQHLYQLARRIEIKDRSTKQLHMLSAPAVPLVKQYRFEQLVDAYGRGEETGPVNASVMLILQNDEAAGLARPLPGGVVRIYQSGQSDQSNGADSPKIFLGEDRIGHTPKGGELRLTTGRAFDVTGKSKRTAFERISNKSFETAQVITVKNAKPLPVQVKMIGHLPQGWRMLEESRAHVRETANRIVWTLDVPGEGEAKLSYRLRVTQR